MNRERRRYTSRDFPPYRHEPGRTPHPERSPKGYRYGRPPRPLDADACLLTRDDWRGNDDYLYGVDLFNAGYFWEAHAVWEELWVESSSDETRAFLQSLIQLAAGCLKRSTGEPAGARKLFASALSRLERLTKGSPSRTFAGIDLRALRDGLEDPESGAIHIVLQG